MNGFIKISREMLKWEWYQSDSMVRVLIHLLLKASWRDAKWKGLKLKPGQVITGRHKLAEEMGMSDRTIRTCLKRLVECEELTIKTTNRFSIITLLKWEKFQINDPIENESDQPNDQQETSKRPARDQQATHILRSSKKVKKVKNKGELKIREQKFYSEIAKFTEHPKELLRAFFNYWSEPNKSKSKMRFEMQKTWDLNRRLKKWASNDFNKKGATHGTAKSFIEQESDYQQSLIDGIETNLRHARGGKTDETAPAIRGGRTPRAVQSRNIENVPLVQQDDNQASPGQQGEYADGEPGGIGDL